MLLNACRRKLNSVQFCCSMQIISIIPMPTLTFNSKTYNAELFLNQIKNCYLKL